MKRIASFFLALALAFSLTACTVPAEKADDGKIQIVATLFPYYDFARAIVGNRADVTLLLSPGREAHSFEPTPLDAVTISESDVFLYNGGEGEYWVDSMLGAAGENIAVIARMMDYVDALDEEYVEGMQGADGAVDHLRVEDPGKVEGNTVFTYLDAFSRPEHFQRYLPDYASLDELKAHYRRGGLGDVKVKKFLIAVLNETLDPIRERRRYYEERIEWVYDVLHKGSETAREEAARTLHDVREAMKINYFEDRDLIASQAALYREKLG